MKMTLQRDLQAVGQERNEDMGFDPVLVLMEDRPDRQIAFRVLERLFHGDELDIVLLQKHDPTNLAVRIRRREQGRSSLQPISASSQNIWN